MAYKGYSKETKKSKLKFEAKSYQNIKVKKSSLEQWLLKPERRSNEKV